MCQRTLPSLLVVIRKLKQSRVNGRSTNCVKYAQLHGIDDTIGQLRVPPQTLLELEPLQVDRQNLFNCKDNLFETSYKHKRL